MPTGQQQPFSASLLKTMKVDVQVISADTIKPSSSTPGHLRHHTLSFLDQIAPPTFMPFLLFYPRDGTVLANNLKQSLSEALTRFYPLAGRVKDNFHVDCNDEGARYVEAKTTCNLYEFLEDPNPAENNKFLPYQLNDVNEVALAVQVTSFDCGGIVIGVVFSHKVADASSFFLFLKTWAAINARGSTNTATTPPHVHFESATIFPPVTSPRFSLSRASSGKDRIVIKRLVFGGSTIAALRDKYSTDNTNIEYPRPSRVEALSAFIYSRFLAATQPDPNKLYSLSHAMNVRTRLDPPLSENYFGNISVPIGFAISRDDTKDVFRRIVIPMRDAMMKVDVDYVKSFQESGGPSNFIVENMERFRKGEVVGLAFTSLCRFPIYEADFGWGRPVWVASARLLNKNQVSFFDTKSGNEIEVWINLDEEDMAKFEVDEELLACVSSAKVMQ